MPPLKFITFILLLTAVSFRAFPQDTDKKNWDAVNPLQWADFKGPVDETSKHAATTFSGMNYTWHRQVTMGHTEFTFTTTAFMNTSKSWIKPGKETAPLLAHEQLHFDISEFFARKLLETLNNYHYSLDYKFELDRLYKDMEAARKAMEEKYDEQANHGLKKIQQALWELYVTQLLSKDYSYEDALKLQPADSN